MPNRKENKGSGGAEIRAKIKRKLLDCQGNPYDNHTSASDKNNTYTLIERCKPRSEGPDVPSERQLIVK
jgi:hypothetical protein